MFSTRVVPAESPTADEVLNYIPAVFKALRSIDDLDRSDEEIVIDVLKHVEGVIPRPHFTIAANITRALIVGLDLGTKDTKPVEVLPSVEATPSKVEQAIEQENANGEPFERIDH